MLCALALVLQQHKEAVVRVKSIIIETQRRRKTL